MLTKYREAHFWSKAKVGGPQQCWEWQAFSQAKGYGQYRLGKGVVGAHRMAYQIFKGDIPAGYDVDHLCRNARCVNPGHLEAVPPEENRRRAASACANTTECKRGHPRNPGNTYKNGNKRVCKECHKIHVARYQAKLRALNVRPS